MIHHKKVYFIMLVLLSRQSKDDTLREEEEEEEKQKDKEMNIYLKPSLVTAFKNGRPSRSFRQALAYGSRITDFNSSLRVFRCCGLSRRWKCVF